MQAGVGRAVAPAIVADFARLGCAACACTPHVLVSSDEVEAARLLVVMSTWRAYVEVVESTVRSGPNRGSLFASPRCFGGAHSPATSITHQHA